MRKISHLSTISSVVVLAFIVPQIAFAAWWNPISWFGGWNFFHRADTQTQVLENRVKELEKKLENIATSTPVVATTTKKADTNTKKAVATKPACTISVSPQTIHQGEKAILTWVTSGALNNIPDTYIAVYKVVGDAWTPALRDIKLNDSTTVSPSESMRYTLIAPDPYFFCATILTVLPDSSVSQKNTESVSPTDSWSALETKYFAEGTQKGWASLYITNSAGVQRFYRSENGIWVQKNTLAESQQPYQTSPPQPFRWYVPVTSGPSAFDEMQAYYEKQRQNTFQRETCERLGGASIGDRCSY